MTTALSKYKKHIVILGGGTAGWMAANLMKKQWKDDNILITLVESPNIGIIGVGEGSTPQLKTFFDKLNISESEWMPACNATYKNGITFQGWSSRVGFDSYFHPFPSRIDAFSAPALFYNTQYRRQGIDIHSHPDRFYLSAYLAQHQKTPIPQENFPFPIGYGYHFDSGLLGKFLATKAVAAGVSHIQSTVEGVGKHLNGDIAYLQLDNGENVSGDIFVDCSGFKGELIQKQLSVPFVSYQDNLFNDSAVTLPSPAGQSLNSQTISTTLKHGWAWDIPLINRTGNGYVYSSNYCSADQAETELRLKLNLINSDLEARHLKMKVGRVEKHWYRNCLAVGLSQGFIEPLEATALHFVQETIERFIQINDQHDFSISPQDQFNEELNSRFEGIRDYIVAHYRLNSRNDTEYWRDNAENPNISNTLKKIVNAWMAGEDLNQTIGKNGIPSYYPPFSWQCLLAGYGVYPQQMTKVAEDSPAHKYDLAYIDNFIEKCGMNFHDHKFYLDNHLKQ